MRSRARIEIPARLFFCARGLDATVRRKAHCPLTGFLARKCPIIRLGAWHPKPNVQKRRDRGRSPLLSQRAGINGTGSRAVPWFEGAHVVRRCAPFSKSEHLGKPRGFLRRCAPLSKMRTENCAPSNRTRARVCEWSASALKRRKNGQAWAEFRRPESRNRDAAGSLSGTEIACKHFGLKQTAKLRATAWPRILKRRLQVCH